MSFVGAGLGSFLGSLIGILTANGIKNIEVVSGGGSSNSATSNTTNNSSTTQIFGTQNGKRTLIATVTNNQVTEEAPFVNIFQYIARIETSALSSNNPTQPDLQILNPFNADCILTELDIVMDANFIDKGGIAAQINSTPIITDSRQDNPFVDVGGITLDSKNKGQEFAKADKLNIWITSLDGTLVSVTITATFGLVDNG